MVTPRSPQNNEHTASSPLAPVAPPEEQTLLAMNVATLIDHLEQKHHAFTRDVLARIEAQLPPVLAAHGARLPVLLEIARTFDELSQELAVHMQKEERILFPYLRTLEAAALAHLPLRRPAFQSALNPIRVMLQEHDAADIFLHRLRDLTRSYSPPPGEGPDLGQLYLTLASLDLDLVRHIDLENRILFPRAVPLERQTLVLACEHPLHPMQTRQPQNEKVAPPPDQIVLFESNFNLFPPGPWADHRQASGLHSVRGP